MYYVDNFLLINIVLLILGKHINKCTFLKKKRIILSYLFLFGQKLTGMGICNWLTLWLLLPYRFQKLSSYRRRFLFGVSTDSNFHFTPESNETAVNE